MTAGYDGNVILWDAVAHIDRWVVQISGQVYHVNIIHRVQISGQVYHVNIIHRVQIRRQVPC